MITNSSTSDGHETQNSNEINTKNLIDTKKPNQSDTQTQHQQIPQNFDGNIHGRRFLKISEENVDTNELVTILSYNILATHAAQPQWFNTIQTFEVLTWSHRSTNLKREIQYYNPDIFCLQELEREAFDEDFQSYFKKFGYSSFYKQRPGSITKIQKS